MTLTDPHHYPSREGMWMGHFRQRRASSLSTVVTDELLEEFRSDPRGAHHNHSETLSEVLNFARGEAPMLGRAFVYAETPGSSYRLARMQGRGLAPELDGPMFPTEADAVVAVVAERLRALDVRDREAAR